MYGHENDMQDHINGEREARKTIDRDDLADGSVQRDARRAMPSTTRQWRIVVEGKEGDFF